MPEPERWSANPRGLISPDEGKCRVSDGILRSYLWLIALLGGESVSFASSDCSDPRLPDYMLNG
jgi:hypothetical protein